MVQRRIDGFAAHKSLMLRVDANGQPDWAVRQFRAQSKVHWLAAFDCGGCNRPEAENRCCMPNDWTAPEPPFVNGCIVANQLRELGYQSPAEDSNQGYRPLKLVCSVVNV